MGIINLLIYGDIFPWTENNSNNIVKMLQENPNATEINVRINSNGGSAYEGIAIYNALKSHTAVVNVYIEGVAASTASLVAMSGDNIFIYETAQILIHNPSTHVFGDCNELMKIAQELEKLRDSVMLAYSSKCNLSAEMLLEHINAETLYTAQEALQYGFVTSIIQEKRDITMYKPITSSNLLKVEKQLTCEELKKSNPSLYNTLISTGKEEERNRIKELDEIITTDGSDIVLQAKYTTLKTKADVCVELIDKGVKTPHKEQDDIKTMLKKPNLEIDHKKDNKNVGTSLIAKMYNKNRR